MDRGVLLIVFVLAAIMGNINGMDDTEESNGVPDQDEKDLINSIKELLEKQRILKERSLSSSSSQEHLFDSDSDSEELCNVFTRKIEILEGINYCEKRFGLNVPIKAFKDYPVFCRIFQQIITEERRELRKKKLMLEFGAYKVEQVGSFENELKFRKQKSQNLKNKET